jgi:hypothetical protein
MQLRQDDLAIQHAGDEVVLLCLRSSMYYSVNPSGSVLLDRLGAGSTRSQLIEALADEFDLDAATAAVDVDAFVLELSAAGLLTAS